MSEIEERKKTFNENFKIITKKMYNKLSDRNKDIFNVGKENDMLVAIHSSGKPTRAFHDMFKGKVHIFDPDTYEKVKLSAVTPRRLDKDEKKDKQVKGTYIPSKTFKDKIDEKVALGPYTKKLNKGGKVYSNTLRKPRT